MLGIRRSRFSRI